MIFPTNQIKFFDLAGSSKRLSLVIFRRWLQFIMESIHRQVVNCNRYAKVASPIQRTAFQQSQIFLNGEVST